MLGQKCQKCTPSARQPFYSFFPLLSMFNHLSGKQPFVFLLQPFYRHVLPANQAKDTIFCSYFPHFANTKKISVRFWEKCEHFLTLTHSLRHCAFKSILSSLFSIFICDYLSLNAEKILMAPDYLRAETSWKLMKSTRIP